MIKLVFIRSGILSSKSGSMVLSVVDGNTEFISKICFEGIKNQLL